MLVSVYIPSRNRFNLLRRAITSVLNQSVESLEVIVVDDCSTDPEYETLLSCFNDQRLKVIRNSTALGACTSRNIAIKIANGDFVTGLDDDDFFLPHRIEAFMKKHKEIASDKNTDSPILFSSALLLGTDSNKIVNTSKTVAANQIRMQNFIGNQIFCRTQQLREVGLFNEALPAWQDWELWIRLVRRFGSAINCNTPTYIIDETHGLARISSRPSNIIRMAYEMVSANIPNISPIERSALLLSLRSYPQVSLTATEKIQLLYLITQPSFVLKKIALKLHNKFSLSL